MNEERNEIIRDTFVSVIEWLEKYIEKSNYFPIGNCYLFGKTKEQKKKKKMEP